MQRTLLIVTHSAPTHMPSRTSIFLVSLCLSAIPMTGACAADVIDASTIRVIDGDTVVIGRERVRFATIDAPEIHHAHCDAELRLGRVATARVRSLLRSGSVTMERGDPADGRQHDRYGRTLAQVFVDGREIGRILVQEDLARPWTGHREPWCN